MVLTKDNITQWKVQLDILFRASDPRTEFYSITFSDQEWLDSYEGVDSGEAFTSIMKDYNEWVR